jgi:hypothetical protein
MSIKAKKISREIIEERFEYNEGGYLTWKYSPRYGIKPGDRAGFTDSNGYRMIRINRKSYKEHRLIWVLLNGSLENYIDHIDGNTENNKIENLRECSHSENHANVSRRSTNTSGFKGVFKISNRWIAKIMHSGKTHYLGIFKSPEDAASEYDRAAVNFFGRYAKTNHMVGV